MINISIVKEAKDYMVIKMPKKLAINLGFKKHLLEEDIAHIVKEATRLARQKKLPILRSLCDFR